MSSSPFAWLDRPAWADARDGREHRDAEGRGVLGAAHGWVEPLGEASGAEGRRDRREDGDPDELRTVGRGRAAGRDGALDDAEQERIVGGEQALRDRGVRAPRDGAHVLRAKDLVVAVHVEHLLGPARRGVDALLVRRRLPPELGDPRLVLLRLLVEARELLADAAGPEPLELGVSPGGDLLHLAP